LPLSVLPKRGVIAAAITALGLALLFSFKTPEQTLPALGNRSGGTEGGANGTGATGANGGTGGTVSNRNRSPAATPTPTPAPQGGQGGIPDGTVTGPTVQTQFGPVQVQITFSGGQMSDVQALQLPVDHPRSAQISSYVQPILRQEVLQAQSAQIDLISGATYTSYAYTQSVQAILDQVNG